ncbi:hypothetical protein Y032_0232g3034 [Ancylostoma ceylanicum]|uniref:Uncharacterized protein n=1 Tax=Ancylostoma ceylanicum TaxID=53326 RepID=A0A016SGI0_9BILA|nr:hypothetical protein Y032_0232g3034 [Ancylostoma ceylanicum]
MGNYSENWMCCGEMPNCIQCCLPLHAKVRFYHSFLCNVNGIWCLQRQSYRSKDLLSRKTMYSMPSIYTLLGITVCMKRQPVIQHLSEVT